MTTPDNRALVYYRGVRTPAGCRVTVNCEGNSKPLPIRLDVRNHSPAGFEWGYYGSGPAQLALAICLDVLGDGARAISVYQDFKREVVGRLPESGWELGAVEAIKIIEGIERKALAQN